MLTKFCEWILRDDIAVLKKDAIEAQTKVAETERSVNQRVAVILAQMDPFEPLLKKYKGTFSVEHEHVEDALNEQGRIGMYMWGWQQKNDMHAERMINWIMDKAGNKMAKTAFPSAEQILYNRAEIANMILYRKEIGRLSSLYEEIVGKRDENFDSSVGVE